MNIPTARTLRATTAVVLLTLGLAACAADGPAPLTATVEGAEVASPDVVTAPAGAGASVVGTASTSLGEALVDVDGLTLYGFVPDREAGGPTCEGACADAWPPVTVDGPDLPAGLDPAVFSVVDRPDGSHQLAAGVWPLYLFAGDAAPGDVNGQGSGDVWFVAAPDGSLVRPGAAAATPDGEPAEDAGY